MDAGRLDFMKEIITNLALFIVFCVAFSGLTACTGGTQPNVANTNANTAKTPANPDAQTSDIKSTAYPPLPTGLAESEFELLDGTKFKVSDKKGKVLLLNIWGTWCGPCRAEMPDLIKMQDKYGPQGFEIIGLNIGDGSGGPESNEQIKKFAADMKLNYTLARSPNAATLEFYKVTKAQVVPQTILVDREGRLRGVFVGGGQRIIDSIGTTLEKTISE